MDNGLKTRSSQGKAGIRAVYRKFSFMLFNEL